MLYLALITKLFLELRTTGPEGTYLGHWIKSSQTQADTQIKKAQALNLNWFSCLCYTSWKARFVQQSYLWSVNEVKARQAKRNQSETAAFMGQKCHWMSAQELHKQAVSSPCWTDWWARGVKNVCKCWRLQAATLPPILVTLKKQWSFFCYRKERELLMMHTNICNRFSMPLCQTVPKKEFPSGHYEQIHFLHFFEGKMCKWISHKAHTSQ